MFILLSKSYLFLNECDIQQSTKDGQSTANRFLAFNLRDDSVEPHELQWPSLQDKSNEATNENSPKQASLLICGAASLSEDYFALCNDNKDLVIFNRQFEPIRHYIVKRTCVKITFKSDETSILTCDKAGDVYEFPLSSTSPGAQGQLLLGHCSMLLDFTITHDSRYIISCDRDEKIRVTHYPNTYNILTYCLGHNEFVSSIHLLDERTLISGSGDGKLILWDFVKGKAIYSFNCDTNLKDINGRASNKTEKSNFPIKSISIDKRNANHVAVTFYNQPFVYLFKIVRDAENVSSLNLLQKLSLDFEPIWIQFDLAHNAFLWVLGGFKTKAIVLFELKQDQLESAFCTPRIVENFNENYPQLNSTLEKDRSENIVDCLFKHYYNNVELYYQRKMLRIENENKKRNI